MAGAILILVGIFTFCAALLVVACIALERRWYRVHPPDDWDGCREDCENDDDSGR